jgi:hypothetical protein
VPLSIPAGRYEPSIGHMPKRQLMNRHAGPLPQVQVPAVHPSAWLPQSSPQPPQCSSDVWVFTHEPLQHSELPSHTRPQAPQFATVSRRVHAPPQQPEPAPQPGPVPQRHAPSTQVSFAPHAGVQVRAAHALAEQVCPLGHAMPQPPQCIALVVVSTQPPPQQRCPAAHAALAPQRHTPPAQVSPAAHGGVQLDTMHMPPWQTCPVGHAPPQRPQWSAEVIVSTHAAPQHVCPAPHAAVAPQLQVPPVQRSAPAPQPRPQPPQSVRLLVVSTHAPSAAAVAPQHISAPRQARDALHEGTHVPPRHTVPAMQDIAQPPPSAAGAPSRAPSVAGTRPPSIMSPPPVAHPAIATAATTTHDKEDRKSESIEHLSRGTSSRGASSAGARSIIVPLRSERDQGSFRAPERPPPRCPTPPSSASPGSILPSTS